MSSDSDIRFEINITSRYEDSEKLDSITRLLRSEIRNLNVAETNPVLSKEISLGAKTTDPVIIGALIVTLIPSVLTKFLEFLHDWAMRKEIKVIKIKIQTDADKSIEIEVPMTTSHTELQAWIKVVQDTLRESKRNKR